MKKLSTYKDSNIQENIWEIGEKREEYIRHLDEATGLFNKNLEDIEKRCPDPNENADGLLEAIAKAMLDMSYACEEFEKKFAYDRTLIKNAQVEFRKKTDYIISKSYFLNHARIWPRGYPGDYKIIEGLYKNIEMSRGIGRYLDRYFLSIITLAVAVKGRKDTLSKLLEADLRERKEPKILDIACGPCREIFELAPDIKKSGAKVTCLDQDSEALSFSANRLSYSGLASGQVEFRKYNAVRMINHERNLKEFGQQDVIYSVGLFDYLDDDVLTRLLGALYRLLSPGGRLITSFKDSRRYSTFDNKWLLDWDAFLQRTEEDMWNLFENAGIPLTALTTTREASGVIVFFAASK